MPYFDLVSLMQKLGMYFVSFIITSGGTNLIGYYLSYLSVDQTIHVPWMQNPGIIINTKERFSIT